MIWKAAHCPKSIANVLFSPIHHPLTLEVTVDLMKATAFCAFYYETCCWILWVLLKENCHHFKYILLTYTLKKMYLCNSWKCWVSLFFSVKKTIYLVWCWFLTNSQTHLAFKISPMSLISRHMRTNKRHRNVVHLWDYRLWFKICRDNQKTEI